MDKSLRLKPSVLYGAVGVLAWPNSIIWPQNPERAALYFVCVSSSRFELSLFLLTARPGVTDGLFKYYGVVHSALDQRGPGTKTAPTGQQA